MTFPSRVISHQAQGTPPTEFQFSQYGVWHLPLGHGEHPFSEVSHHFGIGGGGD
jgi:hypothetical protein